MATRAIYLPPQKSELSTIGGIAGGVIGGVSGGPAGALKGYQAGSAIGGVADNLDNKQQMLVQRDSGPVVPNQQGSGLGSLIGGASAAYGASKDLGSLGGNTTSEQSGAMDRRLNQMNDDPLVALTKAQKAMQFQSEDIRKQYEPVINQALIQAQRSRKYNDYGSIG